MSTIVMTPESLSIIREGWRLLVDQLGVQQATQFVILLERGKGDTVKDIAQYWGDASIDDITGRVMEWKAKKV